MDGSDRTDEGRVLRVQLELDLDSQPVTGLLRSERGADEAFVGWLGFVDALKRLHEPGDAASTDREESDR
jgi:hypothetical protein